MGRISNKSANIAVADNSYHRKSDWKTDRKNSMREEERERNKEEWKKGKQKRAIKR